MRLASVCLASVLVSTLACGPDPSPTQPGTSAAVPVDLSGMWQVEGSTVERGSEEHRRAISGTIILDQEGEAYTSTFTMKTMFPTPEGASLATDVIGKGEGSVEGRSLTGSANTQLVIASVPGVDTDFAFVPRTVTTRIVSSVTGKVRDDGTIRMEIESVAAEGEEYVPTRTTLVGRRAQAGDVAGAPR